MRISAVIPTYNSAAFIRKTLESVLGQTLPPDEILVMDDGSTDDTVAILASYKPRIIVLQQENGGVAAARNKLCSHATGDLVAFLDHDDLWHPDYLRTQCRLFAEHPNAVAFFTGHEIFYGAEQFNQWDRTNGENNVRAEVMFQVDFVRRYHESVGLFMSMSFCCVSKTALERLGERPFCEEVSGVDDCFLFHRLSFFGPIVYYPAKLAAYRISASAQSVDRIKGAGLSVRAMELLGPYYNEAQDARVQEVYQWAFAALHREYGKVLMGGRKATEARLQFALAMAAFKNPVSLTKSLGLLILSYLPRPLQPRWLPTQTATQPRLQVNALPAEERQPG
jgi:glycosyltransferase involved in cell wall biosynthesis